MNDEKELLFIWMKAVLRLTPPGRMVIQAQGADVMV